MNKLLLNSDDYINDLVIEEDTYLILDNVDTDKSIRIIVEENNGLNVIDMSVNSKVKVNIELKEGSTLIYNKAYKNSKDELEVSLNGIMSSSTIKTSGINNDNTSFYCVMRHNNKNTESKLINHGVNNSKEEFKLKVDAIISYSGDLSNTSQENKIINIKNGKSDILPNLIVDNDDVEANHSAYISDFDKEELFYMKSRGLSEKESRELLINGFLIGNLDVLEEYKEKIKAILSN